MMETRRCTSCGAKVESKRNHNDMAGNHAGCGGLLMKESLYNDHKRTNKVY